MPLPKWGGCPSFMLYLPYIWRSLLSSGSLAFLLHRGKFSDEQGKNGQKLDFIWCSLVFSRDFRRQQRAKFKIYLIFEDCRGFRCGFLFGAVVVSTGAGGAGCRGFRCPAVCVPSLCPFAAFACGALLANMPLFAILRAFSAGFVVVVWVCVV